MVVGLYYDSSSISHGFIRAADGTLTAYNVTGAADTFAYSINDSGVFTGNYNTHVGSTARTGFIQAGVGGGILTTFKATDSAVGTLPQSINDSGVVTGCYYGTDTVEHGFVRGSDGTITTFDPSGSTQTFPTSIDSAGNITGWYIDTSGVQHGFIRIASTGTITSFDPSGSTQTFGSSINGGVIGGTYYIANGNGRGFLRATDGTFTVLRYPSSTSSYVNAINSSEDAVGCYTVSGNLNDCHGFLAVSSYVAGKHRRSAGHPGIQKH